MGDPRVVPKWLKSLPLAPEYRPTDTEFADPIAFISRIEQEASAFGICKVIPPLPKPSKRFVFANLTRSLSNSPDVSPDSASKDTTSVAVFTTRQQELGSKKPCGVSVHKQVWQSGELYTLEQFEAKSKSFAKAQLGSSFKDATPLEVETAFWKVAAEKPIYIEYANDVPGSGFAVPEDTQGYHYRRRRGKKARFRYGRRSMDGSVTSLPPTDAAQNLYRPELKKDMEGTAGWKLSNCPWNLQVIARSPGSLTRFMPDEVPGVTSPMVYIAMLFSWFAWHVEDHELHSLNFLHTGAPKTWYAVPGDYATAVEEVVHEHGYGDNLDKLAAYMVLGEKRTLISPEILVASGIPCCRLVQNPGEFVVTFPRAYHVGFSHGFNCGEAANFATSKWLQFAKEAASRRAAMNYLPMLSHQQLLYMLAMSFISRVPRALLPGARSSRLRDRMKEERELHVKKAFLQDLIHELKLLRLLLQTKTSSYAVLWDSDLLPPAINSTASLRQLRPVSSEPEKSQNKDRVEESSCVEGDSKMFSELEKKSEQDSSIHHAGLHSEDYVDSASTDDGDLPCGLDADSGVLPCVACGILGYPFMCIIQPSDRASQNLFSASNKTTYKRFLKVKENDARNTDLSGDITTVEVYSGVRGKQNTMYPDQRKSSAKQEIANFHGDIASASDSSLVYSDSDTHRFDIFSSVHQPVIYDDHEENGNQLTIDKDDSGRDTSTEKLPSHGTKNFYKTVESLNESTGNHVNGEKINRKSEIREKIPCAFQRNNANLDGNWNTYNPFLRPRLFCLRHALEVEELLLCDGGSRILIVCNSDYLKIRSQAMSIDEKVGVQLNSQDILLINANKEELDLINISIDDDECKEQDEDWTMKLGVNLRHFVKGRKQSSQKQELFTLALKGLFSDQCYNRISPSLRWKGKRSRTPYRMMTGNDSKQVFRIESHIRKNNWRTTGTISKSHEEPCFIEICEGEPSDVRPSKCQQHLISNQDQVLHKRFHAVPCENVADTEKQGTSSFITHSNSEFLKSECFADDQRRDSPSPEKMPSKISESLIPEILRSYASCIDGNYLLSEEVSEKDSAEVDDLQLQNPCSTRLEDLVCSSKLPCTESNSEHKVDDPDVSNDHGTVAAYTLEAQCDNILVDKAGFAIEAGDSFLTEYVEPTVIGNSKLFEPILVKNSPESDACSDDEIREPCTRIVVIDGTSSDFKLDKSGLATGTRDTVHLKSKSLDATVVDNPKMLQSNMIHSPEKDTHIEDVMEICTGMTASDCVGNGVDQEATALKEISSERCTVDSLNSECHVNASTSLRGSRIPYEAMQTITVAKSRNSLARPPTYLYVYARRKKLTENLDRSVVHSCTEKSLLTLKNTGVDDQESPARNLTITGCNDACSPASSDEGYDCSNDKFSTAKKRKGFKRKREADQLSTTQHSGSSFVRGPCEGLRARSGRIKYKEPKIIDLKITAGDARKKRKVTAFRRKRNAKLAFQCGLEGCELRFQTEEELDLHKRNRCIYKGCRKTFRNHKHTMRHQHVHDNNRPFKCPWKGCLKSFNWEWARTEHLRLHTGERPYKCSDPECGRTFRFISGFSQHRRKTGHGADG